MASNDQVLAVGGWGVAADGNISLVSMGKAISISAVADAGSVLVDATGTASIYCGPAQLVLTSEEVVGSVTAAAGPAGTVKLLAGPPEEGSYVSLSALESVFRLGVPDIGALIQMTPESILIQVGPPGAGAMIELTPESLTLKVAEATFTLTPGGILETVAPATREVTDQGHNFTAAETELNVGLQGLTYGGPTKTDETEGGTVENETLGTDSTDAVKNEDAAIKITE